MKTPNQILEIESTTNPDTGVNGYATEARQGADYYQWAHNTYLADLHGLLFHVPNEITRAKGETVDQHRQRVMALVAQGLVSGVQDYIYIGEPRLNRPAVGIELKLPSGTVGPKQRDIHERHAIAGVPTYVPRTFPQWRYCIECVVLGMAVQEHHDIISPAGNGIKNGK